MDLQYGLVFCLAATCIKLGEGAPQYGPPMGMPMGPPMGGMMPMGPPGMPMGGGGMPMGGGGMPMGPPMGGGGGYNNYPGSQYVPNYGK
ncbi:hypothetical protein TNCT_312091 [Trichonephila clavata]|uniref:Uncharacterized protein n=1 Tax=Trichonephila clavata TaxID=2740835 RepID=A0A8X6KCX4_TRICU|nr:hypothetical protein TNCT_312091 [Trichonephila clavata]